MKTAIICDLDGTAVNNSVRTRSLDASLIKDWDEFNKALQFDELNDWCYQIITAMHDCGHHIIFLTARTASKATKEITQNWLQKHMVGLNGNSLLMRPENDTRPDYLTKQDLYINSVLPYYKVLFALDDKIQVCNMWRSLGITTLHCEDY